LAIVSAAAIIWPAAGQGGSAGSLDVTFGLGGRVVGSMPGAVVALTEQRAAR
jgi:hypothetical protein